MRKESSFQNKLLDDLERLFPGCFIMKNDATYIQGVPDLLVLYKDKWAMLECKRTKQSSYQPNQRYYIDKLNNMSYAQFVCPENKEAILDDLQKIFQS